MSLRLQPTSMGTTTMGSPTLVKEFDVFACDIDVLQVRVTRHCVACAS